MSRRRRAGADPARAGPKARSAQSGVFYQYRADRARRTLHGIDQQVAKAEGPSRGRCRSSGTGSSAHRGRQGVNRSWRPRPARGRVEGLHHQPAKPRHAEFVIGAYHRLSQIEKSFRMSKHDLRARPIYHHKRESIEAHLAVVFAALAVSRWLERATGWSIKKLVQTLQPYRSIAIQTGNHVLMPAHPSTSPPAPRSTQSNAPAGGR